MKLVDKLAENISLVIILLLVACFICMAVPAWATDDKRTTVDTEVNTQVTTGDAVLTGGDNTASNSSSIGGSRALALANSLGDVDIAGCLGSTQWSTPVYGRQKLSTNWACLAEFYLRAAKYELAAMAMCNTEVRAEFDTEDDCRAAHDFTPAYVPPPPATDTAQDEEIHDQYEQQFQAQQTMIEELRQQIQRPAIRPTTVVQKTEFIDEKKRAQLEALRGEK